MHHAKNPQLYSHHKAPALAGTVIFNSQRERRRLKRPAKKP
jgi:hypothetical protein